MAVETLNSFAAIELCLAGLWRRRGTEPIVAISPDGDARGRFTFDTSGWAFNVGYEFRDALDIRREERQKDLQKYLVWTQGPALRFKRGDQLHAHDGQRTVMVTQAEPMARDDDGGAPRAGWVSFIEIWREPVAASAAPLGGASVFGHPEQTVTQMMFLQLLVEGRVGLHAAAEQGGVVDAQVHPVAAVKTEPVAVIHAG